MAALIWAVLGLPLALAGGAVATRRLPLVRQFPLAAALTVLAAGVLLLAAAGPGGATVVTAGGLLRVDAAAAYLLAVVGAVAAVATSGGVLSPDVVGAPRGGRSGGRLAARRAGDAPAGGRFAALMCLFIAAMSLAVVADNLGVLWVAVEGTTIATAFLVAHDGGRHALEAAWKYVVLGSVGLAIAFLGLVLLYAAGTGTTAGPTLAWSELIHRADLNPATARIGLALTALGLATKAGLAPMHSWLPDAHSQAPAPVSGLMSGVLLSVAFFGILRVKAVSDHLLGPDLMRTLLVIGGLLSLAVAATLTLTQRSYKRLLAYSSIEHMGVLAVGAAVGGPLATAAVLVHILGHGLAKASLFVVAGRLLGATGTSSIAAVHSLLASHPSIARSWLAGTGALLGLPPSVLFLTEAAIIVAGYQRGMPLVTSALLVLLLVVFVGILRQALAMTLTRHGVPPVPAAADHAPAPAADPAGRGERAVTAGALTAVAALSLLVWPLRDVVAAAAAALGVGAGS